MIIPNKNIFHKINHKGPPLHLLKNLSFEKSVRGDPYDLFLKFFFSSS